MKNFNSNTSPFTKLSLALATGAFLAFTMVGCSSTSTTVAEKGQCWSQKGGVGNLLKNSATKAECEALDGKSWCHVAGGCEDI